MDGTVIILTDPLQNVVHLPPSLNRDFSRKSCLDKELALVIQRPALIITTPMRQLYHFRSVDWGVTVLLKSEWQGDAWAITECTWNPCTALITQLMANSEFASFEMSGKQI